jgi:hypothetical protein
MKLAELGEASQPKPPFDLEGCHPKEFTLSTQVQGRLRYLVEFLETADPGAVVRGAFPREHRALRDRATRGSQGGAYVKLHELGTVCGVSRRGRGGLQQEIAEHFGMSHVSAQQAMPGQEAGRENARNVANRDECG